MPTAAKLVSAILLGALGYVVMRYFVHPQLPQGYDVGVSAEVIGAFGIFFGWTLIGAVAGGGLRQSVVAGLTGMLVLTFVGLGAMSFTLMLEFALQERYVGVAEAASGWLRVAGQKGIYLLTPPIPLFLLAGGIVIGALSELTSKFAR